MKRTLNRFRSDTRGNFGVLTAILAVPLIGCAGLAVDFATLLTVREELYGAADAAAIGAISETSAGVSAAMAMSGDGTITVAKDDALKLFNGQRSGELTGLNPTVDVDISKTANVVTSAVSFSATVPTTFMQILGQTSMSVSGRVTAQYQTASFIDFYMLLDNTPSMGVGATPADVTKLQNKTGGCAFACHNLDQSTTNYSIAKANNVTMRIDVVRQATQALTDTAAKTRRTTDQYRMGVYTFGDKAENATLSTISDLSSDMAQVKTYASAIDLMTIPYQGYNNDQTTSFDAALTQIGKNITSTGKGTSASDREKVVFFVTDGVGDSYKPSGCTKITTSGRCQEPIDVKYCQTLKDRGVKIAILYTTYLPLPNNSWYNTWIKPFQSEIPTKMASCASSGLYFEVSPSEGITDAMNALFLKVIRSPRLTS